jgi:hypothetical protein
MVIAAVVAAVGADAQEKPPAPAPKVMTTPLKVQVTISRYQGEKKLSSMPYSLSVNALSDGRDLSRLRMGAKVPVMALATPVMEGKQVGPIAGPITYQDVGTNIDCLAWIIEDGRYKITVTVEDTSVYSEDQSPPTVKGSPTFRTFVLTNSAVLRDGQSTQFTSATDKVSGETVKIDVMLNVVK